MEVYPFKTYEEAIAHIKQSALENFEKSWFSIEDYQKCIDMGISFNKPEIDAFKQKWIASQINAENSYVKDLEAKKEKLYIDRKRIESM